MFNLKPLTNDKNLWPEFQDYVKNDLDIEIKKLKRASTQQEMFRSQGAVVVLEKMLKLKEEMNGGK